MITVITCSPHIFKTFKLDSFLVTGSWSYTLPPERERGREGGEEGGGRVGGRVGGRGKEGGREEGGREGGGRIVLSPPSYEEKWSGEAG